MRKTDARTGHSSGSLLIAKKTKTKTKKKKKKNGSEPQFGRVKG